jgi:hypothetical protein
LRPAQPRAAVDGQLKSSAGWCVGYRCVLGLGAARPIEPVIEANDDRVEIGAHADRRKGVEIVVLAAEVIEIILDLAGEIFHQPEFDSRADSEPGPVVGEDLSGCCNAGRVEKILRVTNCGFEVRTGPALSAEIRKLSPSHRSFLLVSGSLSSDTVRCVPLAESGVRPGARLGAR